MKGSITIKLEGSNLYEGDLKKIAKQAALDAMRIEGVYCTSFHWDTGETDMSDYEKSWIISEGRIIATKIKPRTVVAKTDYRCPCVICSCKN